MESNNFKVVIRIRPPLKRELGKGKFVSTVIRILMFFIFIG